MVVIDGHSHFGWDYFHGKTSLEEYLSFLIYEGIDYGLVMPTPVPVNEYNKRYLRWEINGNKIQYSSEIFESTDNPYREVNEMYFDLVRKMDCKKIFYVPMVHPILDNYEYLENMYEMFLPVALKIHGVGSGVDPSKIPHLFVDFVKRHNIMLIVHTDYDNGKNDVRYDTLLLRELNTPFKWAMFLNNNHIHGILNHGVALDVDTIEIVNNSEYLKVALGPDAVIQSDYSRVYASTKDMEQFGYLYLLKKMLSREKIVFDVDFDWNSNPNIGGIDCDSINRIKRIWDEEDQKYIFGLNLLNHCASLKKQLTMRDKSFDFI